MLILFVPSSSFNLKTFKIQNTQAKVLRNLLTVSDSCAEPRLMLMAGQTGEIESPESDSPLGSTSTGSVAFPDAFICDETNGTIPASTVEAVNANGERLTGKGTSVGIISDTFDTAFDAATSYQDDIDSGDLPDDVNILLDEFAIRLRDNQDEGRAMAQIIHDIAPDAKLSFISGFDQRIENRFDAQTLQAFEDGRNSFDLRLAGAYDALAELGTTDIIVDDLVVLSAPVYQRSFTAQAQERAIAQGISIFDNAGNRGNDSLEVEFTGEVGDLVDFDPTTEGIQGIPAVYRPGERANLVLHWDDPYQSISPGSNLTADFDLFFIGSDSVIDNENKQDNVFTPRFLTRLERSEGAFVGSLGDQLAEGTSEVTGLDPFEIYNRVNDQSESVEGEWHVGFSGGNGEGRTVRVTLAGDSVPATVNGPTNSVTSENANSVGQVDVNRNTTVGTTGQGRNVLLFDDDGTRFAESERKVIRTDFLGPGGINNTFFGPEDETDPDSAPNFFGTSAAAPAVAAVNALSLEVDEDLTPAEAKKLLRTTADRRGKRGFAGSGLINAQAAVDELEARLAGADPRLSGQQSRERAKAQGDDFEARKREALREDSDR